MRVRVITFNVLADCYDSSSLTFDERKGQITRAILALDADIVLLQEVDNWEYFEEVFANEGFDYHYYQRPTRKDGIATLFKRERLALEDVCELNFDVIADSLGTHNAASFRRQNVGLLVQLRFKEEGGRNFLVGNTHLYWSPAKPEVKLAQTRMLMSNIAKVAKSRERCCRMPVILGGDFNSVPTSDLYQRITTGTVFKGSIFGDYRTSNLPARFLADTSLKKLCSWLRLLGVDCAMESEESEIARTSKPCNNFDPLFNLAKSECRIILTSSRKLTERSNCPVCFYVKTTNFEAALVEIIKTFSVDISESTFLTVCGKCGGKIKKSTKGEIQKVFEKPHYLPVDERPLFQCVECLQPYWWNERADSSPARAMRVASRLHSIIKKNERGEEIEGKSANMPSSVYATGVTDEERALRNDFLTTNAEDTEAITKESENLDKMFEVRDAAIVDRAHRDVEEQATIEEETPESLRYSSAYAMVNGGEARMTNWSGEFKGCLDYVFLSENDFRALSAKIVPQLIDGSESEEASEEYPFAACYAGAPTISWPSDHFICMTDVEILWGNVLM